MARKKYKYPRFENLEIIDLAIEGKAVAKVKTESGEHIVFVEKAMPGDIVNVQISKKKKNYMEGYPTEYVKYSDKRIEAFCEHYGVCGGCTRQSLGYENQLFYKQNQIENTLKRIAKIELPPFNQILPSDEINFYRNKLEFTFSNKRWLTDNDIDNRDNIAEFRALGFHIPGRFDKILDIKKCWLQAEPSNEIRNFIKEFAIEKNYDFYDVLIHKGFLRNLIIRTSSIGEIMVLLSVAQNDKSKIEEILEAVKNKFPRVSSIMYVINQKKNDTFLDLEVVCFAGKDHIMEQMGELKFKVGPKSFYQTNSTQAHNLYNITKRMAGLSGNEIVYDLYTGTGTIANFIADKAKKVIGLEYVEDAVEDARINSQINNITNTLFFAGDMKDILTEQFLEQNGKPDTIIIDPPRAGMHPDVIQTIMKTDARKIVYVSCNPSTQARDLQILDSKYKVCEIQPVDMFPHTHHTENIVLLEKKI